MGCLWYIPERRFEGGRVPDVVKGEALAALGLGHLDGGPLTYRVVRNSGPDGSAGLVIGLRAGSERTGIYPGQTWQPVNGGDLFIGWPEGEPPGPEVFLRERAPVGVEAVTMADGQVWEFTPTSALPTVMRYNTAGEMTFLPRDSDAGHFEACNWLFDYLVQGGERPLAEVLPRVAVCLGARYHVTLMEVAALGLFSTDLLMPVLFACLGLDFDAFSAKKNDLQPTGSVLNSG